MRQASRMNTLLVAAAILGWSVAIRQADQDEATAPTSRPADVVDTVRSAVKAGELCFRLTTPAELKALLGKPSKARKEKSEGRQTLILDYPSLHVTFLRFSEGGGYGLFEIEVEGTPLDIGTNRPLTLRSVADLARLDGYEGATNASLVRLDLREQSAELSRLSFDSRTQWPPADKLPNGFDPAALLEAGRNPGLGVRALHEQGIDGRGVHIAIIDQPLLREHREYKDRVVEYTPIDVEGVPPQMHGSPVTSIAVGKTCGTAPAASVHYYAVPMWKWWDEHCKPYAALLDRIVEHNKELPAGQKVRVVSISLGAFSQWPDHDLWVKAVQHAADSGIAVVTCDSMDLQIMLLRRTTGKDPESPASYRKQLLFRPPGNGLGVLAGNRSTAYFGGPDDYIFWRTGGASWTVPYLAGLAALAYQVNPDLDPRTIPDLWMKTATRTSAGLVVNPPGFIEAVRQAGSTTKPCERSPG